MLSGVPLPLFKCNCIYSTYDLMFIKLNGRKSRFSDADKDACVQCCLIEKHHIFFPMVIQTDRIFSTLPMQD